MTNKKRTDNSKNVHFSAPLVLVVVALSNFLATFNETFLNVALTPIMRDYAINEGTVQWVATAYMLVAAVMVPITGFLYQRFANRPLLLTAIALLLCGSLIGWFSPNFALLIVGRVVQAIGTGMVIPITMNLTLTVAPRNLLGTYMGIVAATTTLGPAFGPIAAGGILQASNWHNLFAVFAVVVFLVLVLAALVVPNINQPGLAKLDTWSTITASLGLIAFMYGFSGLFGKQPLIGGICAVIGLLLLGLFIRRQSRCENPLLNLEPFTKSGFNLGLALLMTALMAVFSLNMVLPVFMQSVLGFSPLQAALTLLPPCLIACVLAPIAGKSLTVSGCRS